MFLLNNIEILGVTQYTRKYTVFRTVSSGVSYLVNLGCLCMQEGGTDGGGVIFIFNHLAKVV
jgi:hypothetical protein